VPLSSKWNDLCSDNKKIKTMSDIIVSKRTIDIEKVFKTKSPKLGNLLPGFVYSYLRKIVHEESMNAILYDHREKYGLDFIHAVLSEYHVGVESIGVNNITKEGRYIIAANHPLGGLDGLALMHSVALKREDIVFPVNDLLMYLPNLKPLFIPINKHGSNADNIKIINETFDSDKILLYFPAGLVSRKQDNGSIRDLEWKTTFISRAKKHRRDIIPTFVEGHNSKFFYNLAYWRKKLGIKANIEMLYLADEMFKQEGKTIRIHYAPPIPYQTFDKRFNNREWAKIVKEYVYRIETHQGEIVPFEDFLNNTKNNIHF
jgi:1-acyl-sn-glycerol-3-phosphate acyltransferase